MLNFPKEFFEAEVREDFQVDVTMKTIWATQLEILSEIAKVCERHGLTWYMMFGSLLGTVRHKGFIPWDDDMDICLKREDYMQLLACLPLELPQGYVVRSPLLETGYPEYHSCVVNSDSISIDSEHLRRFHGCPFIVGIDVFPFDYIADDAEDSLQLQVFKAARQGALMVKEGKTGTELEELLTLLEKQCDVTIERTYLKNPDLEAAREELAAGLWGLANEIAMAGNGQKTKRLGMYLDFMRYHKYYDAAWFEKKEQLPFEGFYVPVPGEYDKVLRATYGDYMVRIKNTALHDYPFYKKQLEQLRRHVAEVEKNGKQGEEC